MANPVRKACLAHAARLWAEQPGLTLLEVSNEVRVLVRVARPPVPGPVPGVEAIRQWLLDAVAAGEMPAPEGLERREKSQRQRRKT
jgi:hypothetical protein